jgi:hypothetical protein
MFKKQNKNKRTAPAFYTALQDKLEKKEDQFCNYLQKRTQNWDRRKKIILLALIILFFGGFYTTILVNVIRHEHQQTDYFFGSYHDQTDSNLLYTRPKPQIPERNRKPNPP